MNIIRQFRHDGRFYFHTSSTVNDSVTLWDSDHKPLLHYDSSAQPMDVRDYPNPEELHRRRKIPGKRLGSFHFGGDTISFEYEDGTVVASNISIHKAEGLLDFEVIISKRWIVDNIKSFDDRSFMEPFDGLIKDMVVANISDMLSKSSQGGPVKQYLDKKRAKKRTKRYDY